MTPHLLVGSQDAAADLDLLLSLGVTRVLNAAAAAAAVPSHFGGRFEYRELGLLDEPGQRVDFEGVSCTHRWPWVLVLGGGTQYIRVSKSSYVTK